MTALKQLDILANDPALRVQDWDTYGADPLDDRAIEAAKRFLSHGPAIVPLNDGGIQLEWHIDDLDLELEFDKSGKPTSVWARRDSDNHDLTLDD